MKSFKFVASDQKKLQGKNAIKNRQNANETN